MREYECHPLRHKSCSPSAKAVWAKRLARAQEAVDRLLGCRFGWYCQDEERREVERGDEEHDVRERDEGEIVDETERENTGSLDVTGNSHAESTANNEDVTGSAAQGQLLPALEASNSISSFSNPEPSLNIQASDIAPYSVSHPFANPTIDDHATALNAPSITTSLSFPEEGSDFQLPQLPESVSGIIGMRSGGEFCEDIHGGGEMECFDVGSTESMEL